MLMLDKLFLKFKKLDLLNSQRNEIFLKSQYLHNHSLLKQVINDTFKLQAFLLKNKISPEDESKVVTLVKKKIFKVHDIKEIKCLFEILSLYSDIKDLLIMFIMKTNEDIKDLEITEKLLIYKDLNLLTNDKEVLKVISTLQSDNISYFLNRVELDPKKLDKWIYNLKNVFLIAEDSSLIDEYKKHEIIYLQVCLKLIKKENMIEDLEFLVNKIKERSQVFKINLCDEIKEVIFKNNEEEMINKTL